MTHSFIIGKSVCDGCGRPQPDMVEAHWASGNKHANRVKPLSFFKEAAMALHEQSVGATDESYTPRHIFRALGCVFDVDAASPGQHVTPWIPAKHFITCHGLSAPWDGCVWLNPPFGPRNGIVPWLERFFAHGNGIALVPDRTSAPWWQRSLRRRLGSSSSPHRK